MSYKLGDIYIGSYATGQSFGVRPDIYQARFGIRGHNGIDIFCAALTMVLAAEKGTVIDTGFSEGGYGNFIKILHNGYLTLYAHLNDITVKKGDKVIMGALIGHSGNTGLSDTPHLHFGVAPTSEQGIKTEPDNGYVGYIDPMNTLCAWDVKGLKEPNILQVDEAPPIPVNIEELQTKRIQATNFEGVYNYIKQFDTQGVLGGTSTDDKDAGQKINSIINGLLENKSEGVETVQEETKDEGVLKVCLRVLKNFIIK